VSPSDLAAGDGGFVIAAPSEQFITYGTGLQPIGDVNGDGIRDLLFTSATRAAVVFGRPADELGPIDLDDVFAGIGGFQIFSSKRNEYVGYTGGDLGDLNGDGYDDFFVTARSSVGGTLVIYGKPDTAAIDIRDLGTGGLGYRLSDEPLSSVGDINGDGRTDFASNAAYFENGAVQPATVILFGRPAGEALDATAARNGIGGFQLGVGDGGVSASRVFGIEDATGDGLRDLLVSTSDNRAYLVPGQTTTDPVLLAEATVNGDVLWFNTESSVTYPGTITLSSAGDINGDGRPDIVAGVEAEFTNETLTILFNDLAWFA